MVGSFVGSAIGDGDGTGIGEAVGAGIGEAVGAGSGEAVGPGDGAYHLGKRGVAVVTTRGLRLTHFREILIYI